MAIDKVATSVQRFASAPGHWACPPVKKRQVSECICVYYNTISPSIFVATDQTLCTPKYSRFPALSHFNSWTGPVFAKATCAFLTNSQKSCATSKHTHCFCFNMDATFSWTLIFFEKNAPISFSVGGFPTFPNIYSSSSLSHALRDASNLFMISSERVPLVEATTSTSPGLIFFEARLPSIVSPVPVVESVEKGNLSHTHSCIYDTHMF